mmetsp:Transcript_781/g.2837  ORF Transcript_781/g.2837 Transcript_781/m.2837 type:complete len:81 (+) Transcript_781:748-990(+)
MKGSRPQRHNNQTLHICMQTRTPSLVFPPPRADGAFSTPRETVFWESLEHFGSNPSAPSSKRRPRPHAARRDELTASTKL